MAEVNDPSDSWTPHAASKVNGTTVYNTAEKSL
jgi:hypothetical protein